MSDAKTFLSLFGTGLKGRQAPRCQSKSKRTRLQCGRTAIKGKSKCRFHGGLSTGPKTPQGRARCAQVKTMHGNETRAIRARRSTLARELRVLAELGEAFGLFTPKK